MNQNHLDANLRIPRFRRSTLPLLACVALFLHATWVSTFAEPIGHLKTVNVSFANGDRITPCQGVGIDAWVGGSGHQGGDNGPQWHISFSGSGESGCEIVTGSVLGIDDYTKKPKYTASIGPKQGAKLKAGTYSISVTITWTCNEDPPKKCTEFSATSNTIYAHVDPDGDGGCSSCSITPIAGPGPGSAAVDNKNNNLNFKIFLGAAQRDSYGAYEDAGYVSLMTDRASSSLASPAALALPYTKSGVTRYPLDISQALQQVKMPQGLLNVENVAGSGYDLKVYDNTQVTQNGDGTWSPNANATQITRWNVLWDNAQSRLTLTETPRNAASRVYKYEEPLTGSTLNVNTWKLIRPDNTYSITTTNPVTGGYILTYELHEADGRLVRTNNSTYTATNAGFLLTRSIEGDVATSAVTTYDYYPVDGTVFDNFLRRVDYPDGSWVFYHYDWYARKDYEYSAYGDVFLPNGTDPDPYTIGCKQVQYNYPNTWQLTPSGVVVSLPVSTGVNQFSMQIVQQTDQASSSGGSSSSEYVVPGDVTTKLITTTTLDTNATSGHMGSPLSMTYPDGHARYFSYSSPDGSGIVTTTELVGEPNESGGVTNGKQIQTQKDSMGRVVSVITKAITSGIVGITLANRSFSYSATAQDYTETDNLSVQTTSYVFDCCGLASVTTPDGVVTTYENDTLHRKVSSTPLRGSASGVKTSNVLDADGKILVTKGTGAGDNDSQAVTIRQIQYDILGRQIRETNALGGITTNLFFTAPNAGVREVTLFQDGGSRTNDYYRDARPFKVWGTATRPSQFEYGVTPSGANGLPYVKETKLDSSWNPTSEWTKTTQDGLGRDTITIYADNTPNTDADNPFTASTYNSLGQLFTIRDPDGVTTMFRYNSQGELEKNGIDVDQDGSLGEDGSTDRVSRTLRTYVSGTDPSSDLIRTETYAWVETQPGTDPVTYTEKLISRFEASADGLHTWQSIWRAWDRNNEDSTKAVTQSDTVLDPSTHQQTTTATSPDGTQTVSVYLYGLLQSVTRKDNTVNHGPITSTSYTYDKYDRQVTITDARNGATSLTLNNADLVQVRSEPSAGGLPMNTTTYYDKMLRPTGTMLPDGAISTNYYFPSGLISSNWGARTYPVEFTYDAQGKMLTQKTYQTFSNGSGSGAALTRWNYDANRGSLASKDYCNPDGTMPAVGTGGPNYTYTRGGRLLTRTWKRLGTDNNPIVTTYLYGFNGTKKHGDLTGITYSINDPQGTPPVTFDYDRRGRRTLAQTGATGSETDTSTYTFDDASETLTETHGGGLLSGLGVSSAFYDSLKRSELSLTPIYGYAAHYDYDSAGRLQHVSQNNATVTYDYLANSLLPAHITSVLSGTTVTTTKGYDHLNRLTSVSTSASGSAAPALPISFAYDYNQAGQRIRRTEADGSYWVFSYDTLGQVTGGTHYWQDGTLVAGQQFGYTFDTIGNRTQTKVGGDASGNNQRPATYDRNYRNQITARDVPAYVDIIGVANPAANTLKVNNNIAYRKGDYFQYALNTPNTSAAWNGTVTVTSTYNSPPDTTFYGNLFVPKNREAFTYDDDGNLTSDGHWSYYWDAENRLVQMVSGTGATPQTLKFDYDFQGRRIHKRVWNKLNPGQQDPPDLEQCFIYDGWNLLSTLNPQLSTILVSNVWGSDLSGSFQGAGGIAGLLIGGDSTGQYFTAYDGNGNVAGLIKASDASYAARYEYGPFGEVIRATGPMTKTNPFRFSTKYQDDETDLVYYGYRYCHPGIGRWISRDPIEEKGGLDLYAFAGNSPINGTDGIGLMIVPVDPWPIYFPPSSWPPPKPKCKVTFTCLLSPGGAITYGILCFTKTKCLYNCNFLSDNPAGCSRLAPPNPSTGFPGTFDTETTTMLGPGPCPLGKVITRDATPYELNR